MRNFECFKSLFQIIATHIEAKSQSATKRFAMFGAKKNGHFLERSTPQQIPGIDVSFLGDGQSPSSLSAFEMTGS